MITLDATLTEQELEVAHKALYDLGPGYPQVRVPDYIRSVYFDECISESSLTMPPEWNTKSLQSLNRELYNSVARFLDFPRNSYPNLFVTFSGSVAINRALAASEVIRKERSKSSISVVTTTPCIDIMKLFLSEIPTVKPYFVESNCNGEFGAFDVKEITTLSKSIVENDNDTLLVILLTSPENPTGRVWSKANLELLNAQCKDLNGILILDHCFCRAGVHDYRAVPLVWNMFENEDPVIGIWDTGKTFGLNEEKLGFIIVRNTELNNAVRIAVNTIQFDVSRRRKILFSKIINEAIEHDYCSFLRQTCRKNLETMTKAIGGDVIVHRVEAGSLALVNIKKIMIDSEIARMKLLEDNVGVVSGSVFFHTNWKPRDYIRVSLAREHEHFFNAVMQLKNSLLIGN